MKVHSTLGCGFMESVYHRSLEIELGKNNICFQSEMEMPIYYEGIRVGSRRVDMFVEENVMLELKAVSKLDDVHIAQALNYLEAYNCEIGLLLNFGSKSLEIKRLLNKKVKK